MGCGLFALAGCHSLVTLPPGLSGGPPADTAAADAGASQPSASAAPVEADETRQLVQRLVASGKLGVKEAAELEAAIRTAPAAQQAMLLAYARAAAQPAIKKEAAAAISPPSRVDDATVTEATIGDIAPDASETTAEPPAEHAVPPKANTDVPENRAATVSAVPEAALPGGPTIPDAGLWGERVSLSDFGAAFGIGQADGERRYKPATEDIPDADAEAAESEPDAEPSADAEQTGALVASHDVGALRARPHDWRQALAEARELLSARLGSLRGEAASDALAAPSDSSESERRRLAATLRLLDLAAGDVERAVTATSSTTAEDRDFWVSEIHGLSLLLSEDGPPIAERRRALALKRLREAAGHLAGAAALEVRNLAFCRRVNSYGSIEEFKKYEFTPGQEAILYVEVDNFTSVAAEKGHEASFAASYRILDAAGRITAEGEFPVQSEVCRRCRRDMFLAFHLWIPKRIYPGPYTLQLTVEDLKGEKFGQAVGDFSVRN